MGGKYMMAIKQDIKQDLINKEQLYALFKELVVIKYHQRAVEERLLQALGRPLQRKWMHERIQDQYKHEKIVDDITERYLDKKMQLETMQREMDMNHSIVHELNARLDGVVQNIQLINDISQLIDDFKIYKMTTSMLSDEYIYQARLIKILTER